MRLHRFAQALCFVACLCADLAGQTYLAQSLPQAHPASAYRAQLRIPPGLGYPFATCRLTDAPAWLHLNCQRLSLAGTTPKGSTASFTFRLELEDASGNRQVFPLTLGVSSAAAVVELGVASAPQTPTPSSPAAPLEPVRVASSAKPQPEPGAPPAHPAANAYPNAPVETPGGGTETADRLAEATRSQKAAPDPATPPKDPGAGAGATPAPVAGDPETKPKSSASPADTKVIELPAAVAGKAYDTPIEVRSPSGSMLTKPEYMLGTDNASKNAAALGITVDTSDSQQPKIHWDTPQITKAPLRFTLVAKDEGETYQLPVSLAIQATASSSTIPLTLIAPLRDPYNLGRFRYQFTSGILLSQGDGQFSHSNLFLDFHADRANLQPGSYTHLPGSDDQSSNPDSKYRWLVPGVNTSFDVRLTSVPAAVQNCTPTPAPTNASRGIAQPKDTGAATTTNNCQTGSTTTTGTIGSSPSSDPYQVFLNNQKAATIAGAVYAPFVTPPWQNSRRSFFYGPIIKLGFQTTLENINSTQQNSATTNSVAPVGNSSTFYKNYSYGGRIGLYKLPLHPSRDNSPEIEDYLDIGLGRFSNLPTFICAPGPSSSPTCSPDSFHVYQRQYRFLLEGLLEVPETHGFSIGFSANLAQRETGVHHFDRLPPDDLRFFFGYKFDITRLINTAKNSFEPEKATQ